MTNRTEGRADKGAAGCGRRLVLAALLALCLALTLEVISYGLWWWLEGTPFSWSSAAADRQRVVAEYDAEVAAELRREAEALPEGPALPELGHFSDQMVHPFLGYVIDPDLNQITERPLGYLSINNHGFYRKQEDLGQAPSLLGAPPAVAGSDDLRIGVFGGSVAFIFSTAGEDALAHELVKLGVVGGADRVEVVSYALPGYKQPQQLMTLAYMLSLGERLDVVVNLDGFNDVTLGLLENASHKVHPFYPRRWRDRVRSLPDLRHRNLLGEVGYLHSRRVELARSFAATPLRLTVTGNLVWRALDRRAAGAAAGAEARLAAYRTPRWWPAVSRGPDFQEDPDAILAGSVALWQRTSRQMHDLCAARGIAYHHFLQPNQYVPGSKPLSAAERSRAYVADGDYARLVPEAYPLLRRAGRELASEGVSFHDLTDVFAGIEEPLYIDGCCHFNLRGNQILATAIARPLAAEAAD